MLAGGSAIAGPLPSFLPPIDFNTSPGCANYGDFQFCSAQYLNFLATGDPSGSKTTDYVIQSSQGILKPALVVISNSAAAIDNTDIGTNIDNAYNIFANPKQDTEYGTSIKAGEKQGNNPITDPTTKVVGEVEGNISNINGGGLTATAWDIGLQALADALTFNGVRRDLLIFFDNNQVGTTEPQNILVSALVCVSKSAETSLGDHSSDICFELVDQNGTNTQANFPGSFAENVDPSAFNTVLNYGDPLASDITDTTYPFGGPVLANGTICVRNVAPFDAVAFNVQQCPAGSTLINNNLGTNVVEFIGGIPELNANLELYLSQGYDLLSAQILFLNQNDGFEDIFLLAGPGGPPVDTPEPGTLLLLGLGALGLGLAVRRRKT
jgi:hypothetical protein